MDTSHQAAQPTASRAVGLNASSAPGSALRLACMFLLIATLSGSAGAASSVSQYGITWTFSQDHPVGQFANGDWWVVGPVTIVNIDPKTIPNSPDDKWYIGNGSMLNPMPLQTQGLYRTSNLDYPPDNHPDNDPKYVASKNISLALPYTVAAGNSVYSTIRNPDTWITNGEKTWFKETAVLTVLPAAPPSGSFRPPYAGTDKTIKANWKVSSMNYAVLRSLAIPVPGNAPSMQWLENAIKRPLLEMHSGHLNSNWKASWAETKTGGYPRRTYGREVGHIAGGAGLMLNSNLSNAQKEKLLIYMVQWGIDNYGLLNAGMVWNPNGGHNLGRYLPLYIAAKVLNDSAMMTKLRGNKAFQETANHTFISQADIDRPRALHDGVPYQPFTQDMLGMPEWSSSGQGPHTSAAWHSGSNGTWWGVPYRQLNGAPNCGLVATILLMGGRAEVNQEAYILYHTERYYPRERPGGNGAFAGDGNGISHFTRDMWDVHLSGNAPPPIIDPPPVIPPVTEVFVVGERIKVWRSTWVNSTPSVTTPIGSQATNSIGTIVEGPVNTGTDGIIWFRINYDSGADGWSGADNFIKVSSPPPATAPAKPTGLKVVE